MTRGTSDGGRRSGEVVTFLRKKDLQFVKDLGGGACGRTVVLHDDVIDEDFVCKKYSPVHSALRVELFDNFVREIKILHLLNHSNVVRVFNYYLYPERYAGFILMELVDGADVEDFIKRHPEQAAHVFLQVVDGFEYLERHGILHRDIRPQNILVTGGGVAKIIDFGFGKRVGAPNDFEKSISLNWWCEPPHEFKDAIYDYRTEVYFVGKLFEKILQEAGVEEFGYNAVLEKMCTPDPDQRVESFTKIRQSLVAGRLVDLSFSTDDQSRYRDFARSLSSAVSKIEQGAKYFEVDEVERRLHNLYRSTMLEDNIQSNSTLVNCFVNGSYYFSKSYYVEVAALKGFLDLLLSCGRDRKEVVLNNVFARLDAVPRYDKDLLNQEIPF